MHIKHAFYPMTLYLTLYSKLVYAHQYVYTDRGMTTGMMVACAQLCTIVLLFHTEELVSAWHVLVVLPSPTASCAHLHIKLATCMRLESPFVCASTQVCFSELVDETLATPCTHCQVAFLRLFSHEVGPWAVLGYVIHD